MNGLVGAIAWAALCLAGAPWVRAQEMAPAGTTAAGEPAIFTTETQLVALNVTVTDRARRFVHGLTQQDFAVIENGKPQQVSLFGAGTVPVDLAILLDASSSVKPDMDTIRRAAAGFVASLRQGDRGAVIAFNERTTVLQSWTGDHGLLAAAVGRAEADGGTALYAALSVAVHSFAQAPRAPSEIRRPVIVVLSDGEDTASPLSFDDILEDCRRAGAAVYTIRLLPEPALADRWMRRRGTLGVDPVFVMQRIAEETGARALSLARVQDLDGAYASIATELANQYTLGYRPAPGERGFRRIQVLVPGHRDAWSRTRSGYYADAAEH